MLYNNKELYLRGNKIKYRNTTPKHHKGKR